ncbi:MAG TPA: metallophosphoesterase, partial [Clostridia bacterium]|nr:metallophosphoesterase [Clostridia bacterium]
MFDDILQLLHQNISHRIWFISDLQQSIPENAARCMQQGIRDFRQLGLDCQRIIYLGDAVEGAHPGRLENMTKMQIGELDGLDIPVRYVVGNHDFDYFRHSKRPLEGVRLPFYEAMKAIPGWKSTDSIEDFYFIEEFDDYALVYLSDHAAVDGSWYTIHGKIHGNASLYPYDDAYFEELRDKIAGIEKPVFTASHYAFPGGNRPSPLLKRLLPLPNNVRVHFYGHAHIGDRVW